MYIGCRNRPAIRRLSLSHAHSRLKPLSSDVVGSPLGASSASGSQLADLHSLSLLPPSDLLCIRIRLALSLGCSTTPPVRCRQPATALYELALTRDAIMFTQSNCRQPENQFEKGSAAARIGSRDQLEPCAAAARARRELQAIRGFRRQSALLHMCRKLACSRLPQRRFECA